MAEQINDKKVFSLLEVTRSVQKTIADRYTTAFWVKAEMNKLNLYKQSGHAYPDLVEKKDGKIIAQIRANLWRDDYRRINLQFQELLHEPLKDGIKVLMLVKVNFDPVYGLSLTIMDMDPSFTLGDLEREKQENLQRLKQEGLFNLNKLLEMPLLPKRIAVISVESSKGYADFLSVIDGNTWGYKFYHVLFPALLQGDKAAADITRQLDKIRSVARYFDVVAIIRGGGGEVGLTCYNDYTLARTICQFPIPVLTGIGHSTNETISEMVAHKNAITPTKLAENLIQQFHEFAVPVQEAEKKIGEKARQLLIDENNRFTAEMRLFRSVTESALQSNHQQINQTAVLIKKDTQVMLKEQRQELKQFKQQFRQLTTQLFREKLVELQNLGRQVELMSPSHVLRRGYSITRINGKAVRDVNELKPGDELSTDVFEGKINSVVTSLHKQQTNE